MTAARIRAQFPTSGGFGYHLKGCCRHPFVWASYNISRYIGRHSSRENNVPYCSRHTPPGTQRLYLSGPVCPTGMVSRTFYAQHSVTKNLLYSSIIEIQIQSSYCVCFVFSSLSFWTSSSLDVPAGVTQEESHTGFLIHLLSGVLV